MSIRPVKRLIKSKPTIEGAGVRLRRAFGFGNTADTDPFLLSPPTTWPGSLGTRTGGSRQSPMC
jgi:hypothetical protein